MKKIFIIVAVALLPFNVSAYEPTQTHAGLTEQVAEFYNLFTENQEKKISPEQKEWMIAGAIEEDTPAARAMNHFYDPIRNIGIENYRTAKDWATVDSEANQYAWDEVIALYASGNEREAFVGLGHIIHLIEDMGVPDHTRNDQHLPVGDFFGGDSPFEDWAMKEKNRATLSGVAEEFRKKGVSPKVFPRLGEYFDFLANYSNKNFFSKDTIFKQDIYAKPRILFYEQNYGYWIDEISGSNVPIVERIKYKDSVEIVLNIKDDTSVLASYFDRLSLQIIPSGAGAVDLFFKEGAKARAIYRAESRKKREAEIAQLNKQLARFNGQKGVTGFFARVWDGTGYLLNDHIVAPTGKTLASLTGTFGGAARTATQEGAHGGRLAFFGAKATAVAGISKTKEGAVATAQWTKKEIDNTVSVVVFVQGTMADAFSKQLNRSKRNQEQPQKPPIKIIPRVAEIPAPVFPSPNPPEAKPDIKKEPLPPLMLVFVGGSSSFVPPKILEEPVIPPEIPAEIPPIPTEDAVADVPPDMPTLEAPECAFSLAVMGDGCLLATTTVHFVWTATASTTHYAINKNGAYSTTTETTADILISDFSDYAFEVAAIGANGKTSATSTKTVSVATIPIAINEIAWMGTVASSNSEWLELKNNTGHTIDLSQWVLSAEDGAPVIRLAKSIAPHAFYLLERKSDDVVVDRTADFVYGNDDDGDDATRDLSRRLLENIGEEITLSYASTILDRTPAIIGKKWAGGENSTTTRKTMERYASKESGTDKNNWGTNLGFIKNGADANDGAIDGTPGERNSVSYLINKGEDIAEDITLTAEEGRFVVPRDVRVSASSTLTVEPGVMVSFYKKSFYEEGGLSVKGNLAVRGTAENPVIFNSFSESSAGRFSFSGRSGTSTIDHALIDNTGNIALFGARLEIRNTDFTNTDGGVEIYNGGRVVIENTHFSSTTREAIGVYGGFASIASSTIRSVLDSDAIGVYNGSTITVASTTIDGVSDNGIGIFDSNLSLSNSAIRNVSGDGIGLYDSVSALSNVTVENGGGDGIGIYGGVATIADTTVLGFADGVGVAIFSPTEPVAITGGEIADNEIGVSMNDGMATITDVFIHDNGENVVVR